MNYLAHAFLSNNNEELLIGNFIADHLRGNNFTGLSQKIIEGVLLHRKIDTFTDQHEAFKKSKRVFYAGFEKYSGVLVDIYFDHLLAKNFDRYSKIPLHDFSKNVYSVYVNHRDLIPPSSSRFLDYVLQNNIYTAYASIQGIEKVLNHLSHRIKHKSQLDKSVILFQKNQEVLETNFNHFFTDILEEFN